MAMISGTIQRPRQDEGRAESAEIEKGLAGGFSKNCFEPSRDE
jgi:hypothetical protein